jgi:hypothetical protein
VLHSLDQDGPAKDERITIANGGSEPMKASRFLIDHLCGAPHSLALVDPGEAAPLLGSIERQSR